MFAYRVKKYVGSYLAAMGGADAVIFTGGIGENSPEIRNLVLRGMEWAGLEIDVALNNDGDRRDARLVSKNESKLQVWVIPTNEELLIARDTMRLVTGLPLP
jgi:acetate kinase